MRCVGKTNIYCENNMHFDDYVDSPIGMKCFDKEADYVKIKQFFGKINSFFETRLPTYCRTYVEITKLRTLVRAGILL